MTLPSSPRYGAQVIWVTLHTAEGARTVGSLFGFFDRNQNASSHAGADGYELSAPWVPDERAAWTLLNGNPRSLNLEMCGFAHWTRAQWLSTGWVDGVWNPRQMIRHAAMWVKQKCDKYGLPRRLLTPAEVGRGVSGVIDHARYTYGTGDGDHTDVGVNFPWDVLFIDMAELDNPADTGGAAPGKELIDLSGFNGYALEVVSDPISGGENIPLGSAWLFDATNMTLDYYDASFLKTACKDAGVLHLGCSGERVLNLVQRVRAAHPATA